MEEDPSISVTLQLDALFVACACILRYLDTIWYLPSPWISIYKVHDEAKDKAFELEMSWVCDESKRQHEKVILVDSNLQFYDFEARLVLLLFI